MRLGAVDMSECPPLKSGLAHDWNLSDDLMRCHTRELAKLVEHEALILLIGLIRKDHLEPVETAPSFRICGNVSGRDFPA